MRKQGLDDFLLNPDKGPDAFADLLAASAEAPKLKVKRERQGQPQQSVIAREAADNAHDRLAWDGCQKTFYRFDERIWAPISQDDVQAEIQRYLDGHDGFEEGYSLNYVQGVLGLLRGYLPAGEWNADPNLLPCQNGVLKLDTRELIPYSPEFWLTWRLPYDYDPNATCEPIKAWMLDTTQGDEGVVQVLRALGNAVVKGRVDLHRFPEIIGPGGSGKSTYQRLMRALVGAVNTCTTDLKNLEQNKFETHRIINKRLVLITDSDTYGGSVSVLKALTGGDPLRAEKKFGESADFTPRAFVMIAANEPIQSTDYTSGLERRRLTIPFLNQVAPNQRRDLEAEFEPCLPGLLNWVLDMPDDEVTTILRAPESVAPSLGEYRHETLRSTNPLAEWLDQYVAHRPDAKVYVGDAKRLPGGGYKDEDEKLYPSYVAYCEGAGVRQISVKRFSGLLLDLCQNQLGLTDVHKPTRDERGAHFIGLALKRQHESDPSPLAASRKVVPMRQAAPEASPSRRAATGTEGAVKAPVSREVFDL